jgi:hypothetical protein
VLYYHDSLDEEYTERIGMGIIVINLGFVVIGILFFVGHMVGYIRNLRGILEKENMTVWEYIREELEGYGLEKEILRLRLNLGRGKVVP